MPEIATQTDEFVLLTKEEIKKLPPKERKEYKIELRKLKKEKARQKYNEYMRNYMKLYSKMKYKYDPAFRAKNKIATAKYKEKIRNKDKPPTENKNGLFTNNFLNPINL